MPDWDDLTSSDWWFGENSIYGQVHDWNSTAVQNITDPHWWFGENSFWGVLNVERIGWGNFGIDFDTGNKNSLINKLLPISILIVVGYWLIKK